MSIPVSSPLPEATSVPMPVVRLQLPVPAPVRVLATGAWLKNTACLLDGDTAWISPLHGDLGTPEARAMLLESVARLQLMSSGPIDAVAHDLHPDFFSTEVAQQLAQKLGIPAIAVQHHHAHIAQVQAQRAPGEDLLGWALDGVGLGSDNTAWGGELLRASGATFERVGWLAPLHLPGGDVAAREPWRMALAALHALHTLPALHPLHPLHSLGSSEFADQTQHIFGSVACANLRAGTQTAPPAASLKGVSSMLTRGLNCPVTTSAGRWFDAVAGLLGVCWWQTEEAQAAIALETVAAQWLQENAAPEPDAELLASDSDNRGMFVLFVLLRRIILIITRAASEAAAASDFTAFRAAQAQAAALFHIGLADALAATAIKSARQLGLGAVALSGGCFFNRILRTRMQERFTQAGLVVHLPVDAAYGDAGLCLGQAWVAAHSLNNSLNHNIYTRPERTSLCA